MNKYAISLALIALTGRHALAQAVSVGALGGVPFTNTTSGHEESPRYVVGASVELKLPAGLAVEADALYRRFGSSSGFSFPTASNHGVTTGTPFVTSFFNRQRGNAWEFPLLGKYYLRPRSSSWQPFAGTGFAFRTIARHDSGVQTIVDTSGMPQTFAFRSNFTMPLEVGAVAAAGVRFHAGRVAILPQARYTRWGGAENFANRNEVDLLLGVTF
jgi:hypothetical protein